jgi:hypothetical protein
VGGGALPACCKTACSSNYAGTPTYLTLYHLPTLECYCPPCLPACLSAENEQLEEMLHRADAAAAGGSGEISRLEDQLAQAQAARISGEAAAAQALAGQAAGESAGWAGQLFGSLMRPSAG